MTLSPPNENEIEISIIGPGYGEAILIHVGEGKWLTVDSCVYPKSHPKSGRQASLEYLEALGVDPSASVEVVAATHWHDDHVRGLADLVRACTSAKIVLSDAVMCEELFAVMCATAGVPPSRNPSGVRELDQVIRILEERNQDTTYAIAGRWLHTFSTKRTLARLSSLSPSDHAVKLTKLGLANLLPKERKQKLQVVRELTPNHTSVVLWLQIGEIKILLGADLEETREPLTGWSAILSSRERPDGKASSFKVPHHGSSDAHHQDVWDLLLEPTPLAVLSPFIRADTRVPSPQDIRRMLQFTSRLYATSLPRVQKQPLQNDVARVIPKGCRQRGNTNPPIGRIQLRRPIDNRASNSWKVKLYGDDARHLTEEVAAELEADWNG